MSKLFYRFRSIKNLFDFEELEKQTIYFASPEELNDPMEGYKNLVFNGDKIIWKNFFKHYIMCLEHVSQNLMIAGEEHCKIDIDSIPVFKSYNDFPTSMYKEHFNKISEEFLDICDEFIQKIATRSTPIRKDELMMYLDAVHHIAIHIIYKNFEEKNFIPKNSIVSKIDSKELSNIINIIDMFETLLKEEDGELKFQVLISAQRDNHENISLSKNIEDRFVLNSPNRHFVLQGFIENYIDSLEKLMYPEAYVACFMSECENSSVWGHYGDSHKGICLIYKADEEENLSFENGKHKLKQVDYKDGYLEMDFFKSLGSLPVWKLETVWYCDGDNKLSNISNDILSNQDEWREKYLDAFDRNILTKTKDWEYEKEYRTILNSSLDTYIEEEKRTLKYDFNSLKGLIFGMKTSMEDKLKIVDIIRQKCIENTRDDFELYQAYYSHIDKNIQHKKIGFLKFGDT